jgi:hypothetical protein
VFDKLEADLAKACMSLPASKGFEVRIPIYFVQYLYTHYYWFYCYFQSALLVLLLLLLLLLLWLLLRFFEILLMYKRTFTCSRRCSIAVLLPSYAITT